MVGAASSTGGTGAEGEASYRAPGGTGAEALAAAAAVAAEAAAAAATASSGAAEADKCEDEPTLPAHVSTDVPEGASPVA